jgi:hypothetical protein
MADGVSSAPLISYKISVNTGDHHGTSTDTNVFLAIFGSSGNINSTGNNFEQNQTDIFGCINLGEIHIYLSKNLLQQG